MIIHCIDFNIEVINSYFKVINLINIEFALLG